LQHEGLGCFSGAGGVRPFLMRAPRLEAPLTLCFIGGALLLLLADDVARTVLAPLELPAGVLTAALGSPLFLYLLKTHQCILGARR
jgi:ABC-type Fe3+-siderophore transport system permease subunit